MSYNNHRIPHIMKKHKSKAHPCNFVFFDTETKDINKGKDKNIEYHALWFGWIWGFRYEQGKITRAIKARFTTPDQFFDLLYSRLDNSRPLYVIAHNLGFDLTQVDFWHKIEERGLQNSYCVLSDPPLFISLDWDDKRIVFLDTFNYWKCSVADMGKSLGIEKITMPKTPTNKKDWDKYCIRDVEIIANQVINLLDFLTEQDLGSFGISAPAIAMNTFKYRFMEHEIFLHDRRKVLELERACYHGGLVHNYYIGRVGDKTIYHTDVNSLYPSVMVNPLPCKLIDSHLDLTPDKLKAKYSPSQCCALVLIDDNTNTYSLELQGKLCQVTGQYTTFLCGAELQRAFNNNSVKHVIFCSAYEMQPIFREFITFFWNMRKKFKAQGDKVKEQLVKLIMNSLYGKFGMRGHDWVKFDNRILKSIYEMRGIPMPSVYDSPDFVPPVGSQCSIWHPIDLGDKIQLRYVGGSLEMRVNTGEHSESFCAVAAFVTSYARERIRELQDKTGHKHCYYCDTDSLFVDDYGLAMLKAAGEVSDTELGKLKIEGEARNCVFYGPKDYIFNDREVMKGIRKNAERVNETTFIQVQFEGLKTVLKRGCDPYITIKRIKKTISRQYTKGIVGYRGWTVPFKMTLADD